jgi:hypothetical protein
MSKPSKDCAPPKSIAQLIARLGDRHSSWRVFTDLAEMGVTAFNNPSQLTLV